MPPSLAKLQHNRLCHVWLATRQPSPVTTMKASRTMAPAVLVTAFLNNCKMGAPVSEFTMSLKSPTMLKNILMLKNQLVTNPIATVPIMAIGIIRSGWWTSSARCVAQSKHANAQLVLMSPTMNAIPFKDQPVLFMNVAKTN